MTLPINTIICGNCGFCCKSLLIEITELDVVREPRLLEYAELLDGHGKIKYESNWDREYLLPSPCPFLIENKCSIYPTRPNLCVSFDVGSEQCSQALNFIFEEECLFKDKK